MQLMKELMEGSKRQQSLPYDKFMLERERIEKEFEDNFHSSSGIHVDRKTMDTGASNDVAKNALTKFDKIPLKFGNVFGSFNVSGVHLKTLENGPYFVGKGFHINDNELTSLRHGPKYVGKEYNAQRNKLTSLEGLPDELHGNLDVTENPIKNLKGMPKIIKGGYVALPFGKPFGLLRLPMLQLEKVYFAPDENVESEQKRAKGLSDIVNKHLNNGRKGALELQRELINSGYDGWAGFE